MGLLPSFQRVPPRRIRLPRVVRTGEQAGDTVPDARRRQLGEQRLGGRPVLQCADGSTEHPLLPQQPDEVAVRDREADEEHPEDEAAQDRELARVEIRERLRVEGEPAQDGGVHGHSHREVPQRGSPCETGIVDRRRRAHCRSLPGIVGRMRYLRRRRAGPIPISRTAKASSASCPSTGSPTSLVEHPHSGVCSSQAG